MGGVAAAVSKTAAAPIERVKLLIQNQVSIGSAFCFSTLRIAVTSTLRNFVLAISFVNQFQPNVALTLL